MCTLQAGADLPCVCVGSSSAVAKCQTGPKQVSPEPRYCLSRAGMFHSPIVSASLRVRTDLQGGMKCMMRNEKKRTALVTPENGCKEHSSLL